MFGLTFEKFLLVAFIAAVIIGPRRLPVYARMLAEAVRTLRSAVDTARTRAEADTGVAALRTDWETLDPRRYDPRRIVRDALREPDVPVYPGGTDTVYDAEAIDQARRVCPGQRYVVAGTAAHPRRIRIDSLPADDPR